MEVKDVKIKFISMDPTEAIKEYVYKKLSKVDNFLEKATVGEVVLKERVQRRGVDKDFRIDININVPKSLIIVQEEGEDLYALIDKSIDILTRRFKRYNDKLSQWEGKTPWKILEAQEALAEFETDEDEYIYEDTTDYTPKVAVRKKLEDLTPLDDAEAIERMELMGFNQLLFRNKDGVFCMLYKREDGTYGIVEPVETVEKME